MTLLNRRVLTIVAGVVVALLIYLGIHYVYLYGCMLFRPGFVQLCALLFPTALFRPATVHFGRLWVGFVRYVIPLLVGGLALLIAHAQLPVDERLFSGKQPKTPQSFTARDNKGIRYQDHRHARSAWTATHLTTYTPVVIYRFPSLAAAESATRQLSYIHTASDTEELITDEVIEFGCYTNEEGQGEVVLCGKLLTHALWREAKEKLAAAGGTLFREQAPQESAPAPRLKPAVSTAAAITFVREHQKGTHTYRVHRGPSKAAAMAFLQDHPVNRNYYYLIVETPEGNFGRDIDGIYAE